MWNWTRFALGVGLAGALLLAAPTKAPAGGTIGAAFGEFEVRSSAARSAEVASGEAPFEVGEQGYVPLAGTEQPMSSAPVAPAGQTTTASPTGSPSGKTSSRAGNASNSTGKPEKEKSEDACGAEPSSTPIGGKHKK